VDLLTHAFSVILLAQPLGGQIIGFGIIGTVLPDLDILLHRFSEGSPRLYIFSHGGITHSIPGCIFLSIVAFSVIFLLGAAGFLSLPSGSEFWILGLAMVVGGSLLHIVLDYLAYPGIPLFFPISDRKYTLGIFPGPSLFLTGVSVVFLVLLVTGISDIDGIYVWGIVFSAFITLNFIKWGIATHTFRNQKVIPTFNPLQWILVAETADEYIIRRYSVTGGVYQNRVYEKMRDVEDDEIRTLADDPEMKRIRYFSYFTVAEKNAGFIRIYDPLRDSGLIRYPLDFREISVRSPVSRE